MARFARLENNAVVEIFDVPEGRDISDFFPPGLFAACPAGVEPQWTFAGGSWLRPAAPALPGMVTEQETVERVTARQFMLGLVQLGIYEQVRDWVAAQPVEVQVSFNHSATFIRNDPVLNEGLAAFGKTPAEVDAFFENCATL